MFSLCLFLFLQIADSNLETSHIRSREESFDIVNAELAVHRVEMEIVFYNQKDVAKVNLGQFYNKFVNIKKLNAEVFDLNGKRLKRFKERDFGDYSGTASFSLIDDNRYKDLDISLPSFPMVVKFSKTVTYSSSLIWPEWRSQLSLPSHNSTFTLKYPSNLALNYYEYKLKDVDRKSEDEGVIVWQTTFQEAWKNEDWSEKSYHSMPKVMFAPTKFKVNGYEGSMESWESFGQWFYNLNDGRQELPEYVKQDVDSVIAGLTYNREKIDAIYSYIQNKTRYVSVQLGIGGFQTFPASYVAENRYGDCKALSNYMMSLLQYAGIKSHTVLITGERFFDDIVTDFPSNQFNHIIVAVPRETDTLWYECTSSISPPNYLGSFTGDRHGLLIDNLGGKLVKTPVLDFAENVKNDSLWISVAKDGSAKVVGKLSWKGLSHESLAEFKHYLNTRDLKKRIVRMYKFSDLQISDVSIEYSKERPEAVLHFEGSVSKIGKPVGKNRLLSPFNVSYGFSSLDTTKTRKEKILIDYPETMMQTVVYSFEDEIAQKLNLAERKEEFEFGSYSFKVDELDARSIVATSVVEMRKKVMEPDLAADFAKFIAGINKDKALTALVKF